jgi:acyl-CoA synthetase (AMP-forming)/AMP-acid ligase II
MNSLQTAIDSIPNERIALSSIERDYLYGDLKDIINKNREALDALQGLSVAINGRGRTEFALLLTLLDGIASKILFLPSDIDASLHQEFYKLAGVHFEISMEGELLQGSKVLEGTTSSNQAPTQWIIPTSGTTNTPKLVSHTFASLTSTTKRNLEVGKHYRWGLVFDIYRFSGIQVFLQSMLAGSTLIVAESNLPMDQIVTLLIQKKCNALSATSSFWRKILMSQGSEALPLKQITLGGEIADNNILHALKQKFPQAKIAHIYASTEVGVGFSVTDGKAGFPQSYLHGDLENIRMKVDADGMLWIAPTNRNQQYVSGDLLYDQDGYINTGDRVEVKNGRILFLGRASGAINVGGNKVQPEEVESVLLDSGLVSQAYVYAKNNPMMGSLVCADVVPKYKDTDKSEAKKAILSYCREHLQGFKVPAILKFVDVLQTTQSGKLKRSIQ